MLPKTRLSCFHCDSDAGDNCTDTQTDPMKIKMCKNYDPNDECIKVTIGSRVVRTCLSDTKVSCAGNVCQRCNIMACNSNYGNAVKVNLSVLVLTVLLGIFCRLIE